MLRFQLKKVPSFAVEAESLTPDRVRNLSLEAIAKLPLIVGNRQETVGEHFDLEGKPTDGAIEIIGDCSRFKHLGRAMTSGHLLIHGNAGMHVGAEMRGGRIDIHGRCGDWLGAEMHGGTIHAHGHAGHCVGSVYRGGSKGMRGGVILIDGDAGDEAGACMRRGLIAVAGRCGNMPGHSMIAGNLFLGGGVGIRPGAGMKRGSIVVFHGPVEPPPTFRRDCAYVPTFVDLYRRQLAAWNFKLGCSRVAQPFQRFSGDLLALGKGEILVAL